MDGTKDSSEWFTKEMMELRDRLVKDPYSMALVSEALEQLETDSEAPDQMGPKRVPEVLEDEVNWSELASWQKGLEDEAMRVADDVIPELPKGAFVALHYREDVEEDSTGSISEGESETTHATSLDISSMSETEEEYEERHQVLTTDLDGDEEQLQKGQRRRLLAATKQIAEAAKNEIDEKKGGHQAYVVKKIPRGLPIVWKILEVFTWSCMISQVAVNRGWQALEPVTIESGWGLRIPEVQESAMKYIKEVEPDFIVLAWPCGPWSQIQNINQRTDLQRRALRQKRALSKKTFLSFTRKVALYQRNAGRAVLGENPFTSGGKLR